MRISDWSSDVCSSDLQRVALGLLIGEVIKARDIKLDTSLVEAALDGIAADYEQPEQVKAYYRSRPEMLQGLRGMVLEDQVVDSLIGGVTPSEKRSEEHTSELQSLMRISYAVLCL